MTPNSEGGCGATDAEPESLMKKFTVIWLPLWKPFILM